MTLRLLSSLLALPIGAIVWFGGAALALLLYAAGLLSAWEWWRENRTGFFIHIAALTALFLLLYPYDGRASFLPSAMMLTISATAAAALFTKPIWNALGVPYLILPLCVLLAYIEEGGAVLAFLAIVLSSDSCAFFVGRVVGGWKMAPGISPGKTWSGAMGGLAGACLTAFVCGHFLGAESVEIYALGAGLMIGVAAQAGDLLMSYVKRLWGVKDSGRLIPGHGGILDRMDSILLAALVFPFTFFFL